KVAYQMSTLYERVIGMYETPEELHNTRLNIIDRSFSSSLDTIRKASELLRLPLMDAAAEMTHTLSMGGKILVCGNGGSASQAQHFAGELVGRFLNHERPGLPALSLTADSTILTACGNDFGYDQVFA